MGAKPDTGAHKVEQSLCRNSRKPNDRVLVSREIEKVVAVSVMSKEKLFQPSVNPLQNSGCLIG